MSSQDISIPYAPTVGGTVPPALHDCWNKVIHLTISDSFLWEW